MDKLFLLLGLLLAQITYAGWLTPEEIEQANARMRANNGEEKSTSANNENPTTRDINKKIRNRVATEKGRGPVAVYVGTKQSEEEIANGERIRAETENLVKQDAMKEARKSAKSSGKCQFEHFAYGDENGKQLALAASEECLNNEALRKIGKEGQVRLDAYNVWKDQHQITSSRRSAAQSAAQNAEANRQLNQKLDDIRSTQKYGY